jgi:hypothetical protein
MISLKLRFRAAAICLAAILVLGLWPSGQVYADDGVTDSITDTETEPVVSDREPEEDLPQDTASEEPEPTETPALDSTQETADQEPEAEPESTETPAPDLTQEMTDQELETEPAEISAPDSTPDAVSEETDEEPTEISDPDATLGTAADETEEDPAETSEPEVTEETASDEMTEDLAGAAEPDTSSIDLDTLTAWVQEHPDQLNSLYAGDEAVLTALADVLGVSEDTVQTCATQLKSQNDILVKALESGTDVLTILSQNTPEEAAEALGVEPVGINLFGIKLNYLSDRLSAAQAEAEENGQLDACRQELGRALANKKIRTQVASRYDVESAVLVAFLQSLGIEPIGDIAIDTEIINAVEGTSKNFCYNIFIWNNNASGQARAVTGTYGDVTFTKLKLDADTALNCGLPITSYGYNYYGYGTITVPAGQTIEINDLPEGCGYYILASASTDYYIQSLTATEGTIDDVMGTVYVSSATFPNKIVCINDYAPDSLRLGEEATSSDQPSPDEFEFTIYFYKHGTSGNTPLFDQDEVAIEIETNGSGSVEAPDFGSTITFTKTDSITLPGMSISGVYNVATVKLKNGQNVVFEDLGKDYGFYVVQTPDIHYMVSNIKSRLDDSIGVYQAHYTDFSYDSQYYYLDRSNVCVSLTFVNSQETLSITKQVVNSDTTRDFVFNVFFTRICADTGAYIPLPGGDFTLTYSGSNLTGEEPTSVHIQQRSDIYHADLTTTDWYGNTTTSTWSVAQIHLAAGQTVTIDGLPMGAFFDIVEVPVANYTISATDLVNATVGSNNNVYSPSFIYSDASATIVNTYNPPEGLDLTISKTVTGNMGSRTKAFSFTITLTDASGNPLSDCDISVLLPDQTKTVYTTDASGVLTLSLAHGQSLTLQDLPQGTRYTITETDPGNYTTTFSVTGGSYDTAAEHTQSGALDGEDDVTVAVTNHLDMAVPTGIKTDLQPALLTTALALGGLLWLILSKKHKPV